LLLVLEQGVRVEHGYSAWRLGRPLDAPRQIGDQAFQRRLLNADLGVDYRAGPRDRRKRRADMPVPRRLQNRDGRQIVREAREHGMGLR
jgi:hypothetical protein